MMTKHNFRLLDIYSDYLLSSFGATTATGLSRLLPELSHDQITRMLAQQPLNDRDLWKIVKPLVRQVQSEEAVLIIDDTVEEKPYTDESELITWHYDHSQGRTIKGINLLWALYLSRDVSLPVAFELIQKTMLTTDPKTAKDKWVCPQSKNEMARQMIGSVVKKQIPLRYVLAGCPLGRFGSPPPKTWFSLRKPLVKTSSCPSKATVAWLCRPMISDADVGHRFGPWTFQPRPLTRCTWKVCLLPSRYSVKSSKTKMAPKVFCCCVPVT